MTVPEPAGRSPTPARRAKRCRELAIEIANRVVRLQEPTTDTPRVHLTLKAGNLSRVVGAYAHENLAEKDRALVHAIVFGAIMLYEERMRGAGVNGEGYHRGEFRPAASVSPRCVPVKVRT